MVGIRQLGRLFMAAKYLGSPLMHCWGWPWHRIFVLPELRSGSAECERLKLKLRFSSSFLEVSWILVHPETSTALKTEQVLSSEGPLDLKALAVKKLRMEHPIFHASHVRISYVQQRFLHLNRETKHSNSPHWSMELYPASRSHVDAHILWSLLWWCNSKLRCCGMQGIWTLSTSTTNNQQVMCSCLLHVSKGCLCIHHICR